MYELSFVIEAVRNAGFQVLSLQSAQEIIAHKLNNDIVTQADLLVNEILHKQLMSRFPGYGWLSEETMDDKQRLACRKIWVVDPIDGTKEFAAGIPEYAISIALIENHQPILACVFNPATDELFHAIHGGGAWLNGEKIYCSQINSANDLILLASRSEYDRGEWAVASEHYQVKSIGSIAYKLALVASGRAAGTYSLGNKNEWDIAAGVLLVTEAGGVVTNVFGNSILFNQASVTVSGIIATTKHSHDEIIRFINRIFHHSK